MVIGEAAGKALDHSDLPIGGAEQHRPASEVILRPSNTATTFRPSTGAKPDRPALHSVCIGTPLCPEINRFPNSIFSDPRPDAPTPFEKCGLAGSLPQPRPIAPIFRDETRRRRRTRDPVGLSPAQGPRRLSRCSADLRGSTLVISHTYIIKSARIGRNWAREGERL